MRSCIVRAGIDELKMSTLGPKSGFELPAAMTGPLDYASSPSISLNLIATSRSPIQDGSQCIDVATLLFSLARTSRVSTASQLAHRTLKSFSNLDRLPPPGTQQIG